MIEIYGPDKVGSYIDESFKELVERINQEIAESDSCTVSLNINDENYKYRNKLIKLYEEAGWDSVDLVRNYEECTWDYSSITMTLRKYT